MTKLVTTVLVLVIAVSVMSPTLIAVAHIAVPLVLAIGLVVILVRLAWRFTGRW